jgi:hypothetical protein
MFFFGGEGTTTKWSNRPGVNNNNNLLLRPATKSQELLVQTPNILKTQKKELIIISPYQNLKNHLGKWKKSEKNETLIVQSY